MLAFAEEFISRATISDDTLTCILVDDGAAGGIFMNMDESDLQKEAEEEVWSIFAFWQLWCCPKFLAFSRNAVLLVDENDEVNTFSLITEIDTLVLKLFSSRPASEMTNEGQGANPIVLLKSELSERQKQADAAVLRNREFDEEANMPNDVPETPRKICPVLTDSNTKD
jgi:hypothetical protein